jgi:dihydropteroate synthase
MRDPPGYGGCVNRPDPHSADPDTRRQRRLALLEALREAAELRARTRPRRQRLERARALLQARHTRG